MNSSQFTFLTGLLFIVLSRLSKGNWSKVWAIVGAAALIAVVAQELYFRYKRSKQAKQPPFALQTTVYFDNEDQRDTFKEGLPELVAQARRVGDSTNGLNEEQLAEAGLDEEGRLDQSEAAEEPLDASNESTEHLDEVATADSVQVGQIYRDNDPRVERVVKVTALGTDKKGRPNADLVNMVTGYRAHALQARLLSKGNRGYTYEGMSK